MRIWGYILIVLNLGAAGAFTYLATSVWKARTEWQYLLIKQELANQGLPLEAPEHPETDLDKGVVPFGFTYQIGSGVHIQETISEAQLTKLIPSGGSILGTKGGPPIANQTDEVKRVLAIVFHDLDTLDKPPEKRSRLLLLLVNLAKGMGRQGTFALLYDYPRSVAALKELDDANLMKKQSFEWQVRRAQREREMARTRQEMAYLGQTGQQLSALLALNAVEEANLAYAPNVSPEEKDRRLKIWRDAIIGWALGQVSYATPDPLPPTIPPPPSDRPAAETVEQKEKERLTKILEALEPLMKADKPDAAQIEEAKKRLLALLDGDDSIRRGSAKIMIPFIADVGANLLDNEEKVAETKKKLVELMALDAATEAEKKSLAAVADLIVPPKSEAGANEIQRADAAVDAAATERLRSYFELALAKPSTDLPLDVPQARSKLAGLKPILDVGDKRRAIAHLLYHLDAYAAAGAEGRASWYNLFILADPKASTSQEGFRFAPVDEELRKSRPNWQQRVAAVVGLESYVEAAKAQAAEFAKMVERIRPRIVQEQGLFETEYQRIVEAAIVGAKLLSVRQQEVKEKEANRDYITQRLTIEEAERKKQQEIHDAAVATAKTALTNLEMKVDELFQITKQLGEAQDRLVELELKLRRVELGQK